MSLKRVRKLRRWKKSYSIVIAFTILSLRCQIAKIAISFDLAVTYDVLMM